jgi:hypothetical protein
VLNRHCTRGGDCSQCAGTQAAYPNDSRGGRPVRIARPDGECRVRGASPKAAVALTDRRPGGSSVQRIPHTYPAWNDCSRASESDPPQMRPGPVALFAKPGPCRRARIRRSAWISSCHGDPLGRTAGRCGLPRWRGAPDKRCAQRPGLSLCHGGRLKACASEKRTTRARPGCLGPSLQPVGPYGPLPKSPEPRDGAVEGRLLNTFQRHTADGGSARRGGRLRCRRTRQAAANRGG